MGSLAWRRIWPTTVLLCACAAAGRSCVDILYHCYYMLLLFSSSFSRYILVILILFHQLASLPTPTGIRTSRHGHIVQLEEHPICIRKVQVSITCLSNFCFLFWTFLDSFLLCGSPEDSLYARFDLRLLGNCRCSN